MGGGFGRRWRRFESGQGARQPVDEGGLVGGGARGEFFRAWRACARGRGALWRGRGSGAGGAERARISLFCKRRPRWAGGSAGGGLQREAWPAEPRAERTAATRGHRTLHGTEMRPRTGAAGLPPRQAGAVVLNGSGRACQPSSNFLHENFRPRLPCSAFSPVRAADGGDHRTGEVRFGEGEEGNPCDARHGARRALPGAP